MGDEIQSLLAGIVAILIGVYGFRVRKRTVEQSWKVHNSLARTITFFPWSDRAAEIFAIALAAVAVVFGFYIIIREFAV